jgi:hypothetical protein
MNSVIAYRKSILDEIKQLRIRLYDLQMRTENSDLGQRLGSAVFGMQQPDPGAEIQALQEHLEMLLDELEGVARQQASVKKMK